MEKTDVYLKKNRNGSLVLSYWRNGFLNERVYYDYSQREALKLFAIEMKIKHPRLVK